MSDVRENYLAVFLKEWELYRQKGTRPAQKKVGRRDCGASFEGDVKVGEIRVFADSERPLIGLVLADQHALGWLVVPVSAFTVPATEQEILVGSRVFQAWNASTLAHTFVARSWLVATLDDADVRPVAAAVEAVLRKQPIPAELLAFTGMPIVKTDDPRLDYEREFALAPKNVAEKPAAGVVRSFRWNRFAYGLAACFVVMAGVTTVMLWQELEPMNVELALCYDRPPESACVDIQACAKSKKCPEKKCRVVPECRSVPNCAPCAEMACARSVDGACEFEEPDTFERERYAEYVENEFVETKTKPLSTFGLDVDTASYATFRRYLTEMKRLPPKDSVRLEEWVNYFNYSYPEPKGDVPIAVTCELAGCPWKKDHKLLRVALKAKSIAKDKLPPSNLVFLMDCSGSMEWNGGFAMAQKAMRLLVEQLRPEDSVSIVTYASGTSVRLPATRASDKAKIVAAIDAIRAGGSTSGGAGIELAYNEAKKNFDKRSNNRVILVTDGDFNVGVQSTQELVRMIEKKRESGVFLSVLGVGCGNYRDEMMKRLSNAGNGNYAFIDSALEAKKVLMTEFGASMYTVAKDVKLQLEFNPSETQAYRLLGYECRKLEDKDFNDDKKDSGEMGAGHTMTAFYELIPVGVSNDVAKVDALKYQQTTPVASKELLTVKLRYKEPTGDKSRLVETPVVSGDIVRKGGPSSDFRFASSVAEMALLMEDSKFKGSASVKQVLERARKSKGADDNGYRAEFIRLVEMAELYPQMGGEK